VRDPKLTERARQMRKEMTEPEQRLWFELRAKRFQNVKFRKQKVIGRYIADFASRDPMLVLEIDGDTHGNREVQDAERTAFLQSLGYKVVRFTNSDVMTNMEGVLTNIGNLIGNSPLPTLSPEGERAI
jgi:very-short-patch-repair endonuclease